MFWLIGLYTPFLNKIPFENKNNWFILCLVQCVVPGREMSEMNLGGAEIGFESSPMYFLFIRLDKSKIRNISCYSCMSQWTLEI